MRCDTKHKLDVSPELQPTALALAQASNSAVGIRLSCLPHSLQPPDSQLGKHYSTLCHDNSSCGYCIWLLQCSKLSKQPCMGSNVLG